MYGMLACVWSWWRESITEEEEQEAHFSNVVIGETERQAQNGNV